LGQKLAKLGATMILRFLESIESNKAMEAKPQNEEEATYAKKIDNHEAIINWHEAAVVIERKIRAFYPDPVAKSTLSGTPVRFSKPWSNPKPKANLVQFWPLTSKAYWLPAVKVAFGYNNCSAQAAGRCPLQNGPKACAFQKTLVLAARIFLFYPHLY